MMKTYKLADFKKEYADLFFSEFLRVVSNNKNMGRKPEEVYNCIDFVMVTNYAGDEVPKPDGISQEMRHWAKILSHSLQCN